MVLPNTKEYNALHALYQMQEGHNGEWFTTDEIWDEYENRLGMTKEQLQTAFSHLYHRYDGVIARRETDKRGYEYSLLLGGINLLKL